MKNNQKGITLVALVITIIVLLILAGVTILAVSGQNNILKRGSQAKINTEISNAKDLIIMGIQECITDYYNAVYVNEQNIEAGTETETPLAYIHAHIASTSAKSVIEGTVPAIDTTAKTLTITTNVKDKAGTALTVTINEQGEITTWNESALTLD